MFTVDHCIETHLIKLALAVEARSQHPLVQAVVRHAAKLGFAAESGLDVQALTGRGVRALVEGELVYLRNERLFVEMDAYTRTIQQVVEEQAGQGRTAVIVGVASSKGVPLRPVGVIAIADRVRPGAKSALMALHAAGISRVVMLTRDNEGTARSTAQLLGGSAVGVDEFRSEMLPQDKTAAVKELQLRHGWVLFVGDGVNDAPALAAAEVGVAMGAGGSDAALETVDIALMGDDLSKSATTIRLARKAERIIGSNIAFALATKALFVVLAVLGYATLWMAVFADMGASLLVVLNGMRALRD